MRFDGCGLHNRHQSEAAMIGEDDPGGRIGVEDDMIVLSTSGFAAIYLIMKCAKSAAVAVGIDNDAPAHAQMDHQRLTAVKVGHDIFRPPPYSLHSAAGQAIFKVIGEGDAQIGAPRLHTDKPSSFDARLEAAFDGFNFGQFRHDVRCSPDYGATQRKLAASS